ncbi:MAG: hypothetical protein Q7S69_09025 [Nitrosomonadaceae bacterium]|nr:hypothetical protein [Nitrosomonadaceae bacterium]
MDKLKLETVTAVIVSDGNNPRILNQDFLERNDIVPAGWKEKQVIVTPPFSLVEYEGFSVQMEENKLSITAKNVSSFAWDQLLPKVAIRLLEVLPHVSYKAVGLNFSLYAETIIGRDAENKLIEQLLTKGDWLNVHGGITGALVELQFRKSFPHLNVKVGVRETISDKGRQLGGYTVMANFHHDFESKNVNERIAFISKVAEYEKEIHQLINSLPMFKL